MSSLPELKSTVMYCAEMKHHRGGTVFINFFSNVLGVRMCGDKEAFKVQVTEDPAKQSEYWGWWDIEEQRFLFVWPSQLQLDMCFPYGMKIEEKHGKGKGMPVTITVLEGPICLSGR